MSSLISDGFSYSAIAMNSTAFTLGGILTMGKNFHRHRKPILWLLPSLWQVNGIFGKKCLKSNSIFVKVAKPLNLLWLAAMGLGIKPLELLLS